jgi:hypothetical protein
MEGFMENFIKGITVVVLGLIAFAFFSLLFAFPIKWCWNYTMPFLFGLPTITWGHAWCLSFLAHNFFGRRSVNSNQEK